MKPVNASGKVGMWPFVEEFHAQSASRHWSAGTLELKTMTETNFLREEVLPLIRAKFLRRDQLVYVQQGGVPVHFRGDDPQVVRSRQLRGWDMSVVKHPPTRPISTC